jgi:hypothetical protein
MKFFAISLLIINDYRWRDMFLIEILVLSILLFNIKFKYDRKFLGGFYIHIHVPMHTYMKTCVHIYT